MTPDELLDTIYALGERLADALATGDAEAFDALTRERGHYVERLRTCDTAGVDPARAEAFARQHEQLVVCATERQERLGAALGMVSRLRHAADRYATRRARPTILSKQLRG